MILLAGAFELVPLLVVLVLAVAVSIAGGLSVSIFGIVAPSPWILGVLCTVAFAGLAVFVERYARNLRSRRVPEWISPLDTLARHDGIRIEAVGAKAFVLARLAVLGVPIPDGVVLTTLLVERIRAATVGAKGIEGAWNVLPAQARRELDAFLVASKGKVVVRASFASVESKHSYAGVFPLVRDVDPKSRDALIAAVLHVVAAAEDPVAQAYRSRTGARAGVARAVIVQRQMEPEILGAMVSRGPGGAADSLIVDVARKRSPLRSLRYDLVEGKATALVGEDAGETPAWMHRLAVLTVVLESELGGPIKLEYAVEDGQPYVLDARRTAVAERKTWVHARPLDASAMRLPTFARELRGGLPLLRRTLSEMLTRVGAPGDVKEEEVRTADGLVYFDAEVLRRAVASLGKDVLLEGGLRATFGAIAQVPRRPLPAVPAVTEITRDAWSNLRTWHAQHLLGAAQVHFDLDAREWLIRTLLRLVDGSGSQVDDCRGHPALRFILARRLKEAAEEAGRQRAVLEQAETELGSAVARVLARSAAAWNAMFKGDRHLHATLEEIDAWHADIGGRDVLEEQWRSRGVAFDQRRNETPVLRVHRPPLPEAPADASQVSATSRAPGKLAGIAVVAGNAAGPLVILGGQTGGDTQDAIVAVNEPRTNVCAEVYGARGIVLLGGGLASPVAELAAELGVPMVLCPSARAFSTREVLIDGATGTVTVRR